MKVYGYYRAIRQLKGAHPEYRRYLVCCKRCGIFFFTDPRNKWNKERNNLRCPFGCRDFCYKQNSNNRSKQYYQSAEGKMKKRKLNELRRKRKECGQAKQTMQSQCDKDEELISYLGSLYRMLEGGTATRAEIVDFIKEVRQQGMDKKKSGGYIEVTKDQSPPNSQ